MGIVKGTARLKRIMYPKGVYSTDGGFTIASFEPISIEEGNIEVNERFGTFTIKGELPPLRDKGEYHFTVEEGDRHPQFGMSYENVFMRQDVDLDTSDKTSVRNFLKVIMTERQLDALYDAFDEPMSIIEEGDISKLTEAKGIGIKTAERIINHYESQKDYSVAYMELGEYDISPKTIRKVVTFYGSPELAILKIKEDPYELMKIDGYGFKTCDAIFMRTGGTANDPIRIRSFLIHVLKEEASKGHTWSSLLDVFKATIEYIPSAEKTMIGKILTEKTDLFYLSEDKKRISLVDYQKLETLVSEELNRLLTAENSFDYEGWEDDVASTEENQGWSFTDQQKEAMLMMLDNNVSLLQGYGGTGKTTTLKAVADVLESKGYIYAQCALSGKASNNLTLVTGKDGSTIHRLLSYNPIDGGFFYNNKNPLPYDIIILDEVSMVDARLFAHLLLAIRTGAKLIMLGDSQQLESIGIPVMIPMIASELIPTMTLTQIHRQAQMSAVVTDSIAIRQGVNVLKDAPSSGRVVHGELKDLEYELVNSDDEIFVNVMKEFYKHMKKNDINDIQILTQTRKKCLEINRACQKVYNAYNGQDQVEVGSKEKDTDYYLRVGDKVMNVKNNYNSVDEFDQICPVFNGNIGILEDFGKDDDGNYMLINFEGIGRIKIHEDNYNTIELAYCISIHKSQGSSSKVIIIALPFHYLLNSRQLVYTAITRTREYCIVIAMKNTFVKAVQKDDVSFKRTYLADYLKDLSENSREEDVGDGQHPVQATL
ncbi:AAA family ATPase [Bacillus velezensis]|uniref:AAA family ATPase n=1 Tax=Bacillus velezensis TaxID=492670 RepID=UPI0011A00323|nr:AAA family ATPase [Bacillus velezensis]